MRNRTKPSSDPIRGSLEAFHGTSIEMLSNEITSIHKHNAAAPHGMYLEFRNTIKADVAIYIRRAVMLCGIYYTISDKSRQIIYDNLIALLDHPYCHSFVICVLDTYNDQAILDTLNVAKCNSPVPNKAIQHATMDIKKAMKSYLKPITRKMEAQPGTFPLELLRRYRDIDIAIDFVCTYFKGMFCGKLPQTMEPLLYDEARRIDPHLAHFYVLSEDGIKYELINRRKQTMLSAVSQECATRILCYQWIRTKD